jgi:hypothetical protein
MNDTLGQAKIVRRRTPTWPSRMASYWDFTPWGGGFMRTGQGPGAVVLQGDVLADMRTGRVYRDARFVEVVA